MYKNNADELVYFEWLDHGLKAPNLTHLRRHCVPSAVQSSRIKRRVEWSSHKNNESEDSAFCSKWKKPFQKKYRHQMSFSAPSRGLGKGTGVDPALAMTGHGLCSLLNLHRYVKPLLVGPAGPCGSRGHWWQPVTRNFQPQVLVTRPQNSALVCQKCCFIHLKLSRLCINRSRFFPLIVLIKC